MLPSSLPAPHKPRPASELGEWARSLDAIAAAVGLATLNALIEPPLEASDAHLLDLLLVTRDDVAGMVGYFGPLVEPLRGRVKELRIFERHHRDSVDVFPEWAAEAALPECQVVLISATTLLNRTADALLGLTGHARKVVVLGPSTPLLPELFGDRGVTLLSGVQVVDPGRVLRIVSEGGGTRQLGTAVRKLTVRLASPRVI
jgi:uncharacterized protein (DUF4213/DUF364 family)